MSQDEQILDHLRAGHTITPLDALAKFQCFRLGARIYELKRSHLLRDGEKIVTETHTTTNGKRIARYRLVRPMFQENLI